jgi:hypothetical protein
MAAAFDRDELVPPSYLDELDADAQHAANDRQLAERVPPHDLEAEAAVLSAVMVDATALAKVVGFLQAPHFYAEAHRRIYEAAVSLAGDGKPVDVVTVATSLRDHERLAQVGGMPYLTEILNAAPKVANVEAYGRTVHEKWRERHRILLGQRLAAEGYAGQDTTATLAELEALATTDKPRPAPWLERLTSAPDQWYTEAPPKRTWLLRDRREAKARGVLPLGKLGQLIGAGGIAKTTVAAQLAVAVATGTPWLGCLDVASPGPVLFVVAEEDLEECRRKLHNAAQVAGVQPDPGSIVVLPLAGMHVPMLELDDQGNARETQFLAWLRRTVVGRDFRLVILDPLTRFAGPEAEKDNAQATRFVEACESLLAPSRSVLVAHHTNQTSRSNGAVDATAGRGVTGLVDGPRWQCALSVEVLKFDAPEEAERLGEVVTFKVTKSNYAVKPPPIVLRRDPDHGGALRPLDAADLEAVDRVRGVDPLRVEKRRVQATELGAREAAEDKAVRQAVNDKPGIPLRELRERVRALAHCGRERAEVAIARVAPSLDVREGPRSAKLHFPKPEART